VRGQRHAPAALNPRERPGTHCSGAWVGPGPVWTGAENLAPPGFDPRTLQASQVALVHYLSLR